MFSHHHSPPRTPYMFIFYICMHESWYNSDQQTVSLLSNDNKSNSSNWSNKWLYRIFKRSIINNQGTLDHMGDGWQLLTYDMNDDEIAFFDYRA